MPEGDTPPLHPMAEAAIQAHAVTAPKDDTTNRARLVDMLETFEQDIHPLIAPFVADVVDHPDTPEHVKALLSPLVAPQHFGESVVIGIAVGSILSPVLQAALDPLLAELAKGAWRTAIGGAGALGGLPQSPSILAAAVLKGVLTRDNAKGQAVQSGVGGPTFDVMVDAAGQAIGIEQALLLYRRGQISADRLLAVERYSNLNPAFYDMVPMLRYAPLSVGEAVTAALKGHMSDKDATDAIGYAGIDPVHFPVLKASAGRPLGLQEMLHLWNREKMTEAQVDAGIRQSDINDTYLPFAKELRHYYPPPRSLVPMLRSKAITDAQFRLWMSYYGAPDDVVTAFQKEAASSSTSTAKTLTQAQVTASYELRLSTRPAALARLEGVGFDAEDANAILDLADEKRSQAMDNAVVRMIGSRYVTHKLSKPEATTQLNAIPIPAVAIGDLFHLWDIERAITVHHPSPAGVVGALRRGILTPKETYTRLTQMGVPVEDLAIVVGDGYPPTAPQDAQAAADAVIHQLAAIPGVGTSGGSAHKSLTASQVTRLYSAGTLSRADAIADLVGLGYTNQAAQQLLTLVTPPETGAPTP